MINYADIPLHIRCTNRRLIDPTYPGGCTWYKMIHQQFDSYNRFGRTKRRGISPLSDRAIQVCQLLQERGEMYQGELAKILGVDLNTVTRAVGNLQHHAPVYETSVRGLIVYGLNMGHRL